MVGNHVREVMVAAIVFHGYVGCSDMAEGWVVADGLRLTMEMGFLSNCLRNRLEASL